MISYGQNIKSAILPCDEAAFNRIVDSPEVERLCSMIAAEPDHKKQGEMKRGLPFFCFHASFRNGRRIAKDAIPSGFAMIDIDGIESPREVWEGIEPRKEELDIVLAHVTPSRKGLRLVAPLRLPRGGEAEVTGSNHEGNHEEVDLEMAAQRIVETQKWLVRELKLENVDCVVKDLARCSFAVPRSYILHLNNKLFSTAPLPLPSPEGEGVVSNEREKPSPSNTNQDSSLLTLHSSLPDRDNTNQDSSLLTLHSSLPDRDNTNQDSSLLTLHSSLYNGIEYSAIVKAWLSLYLRQKPGYRTFEAPAEGDRNNTLYDLCRDLRNICDYSFQKILDVVPSFGLERAEVEQTVLSALKAERRRPYILNNVLTKLTDPQSSPLTPEGGTFYSNEGDNGGGIIQSRVPPLGGRGLDARGLDEGPDSFNSYYLDRLPPLPPMMKALMNGAERKYHMPIIVGMLPILCSYADKVIYRYADGRWRRPNMMSFIIGPPMSGKSAVSSQLNPLMDPMRVLSQKVRDEQDKTRRKNNERSDKEKGSTFSSFIKKLNMDITDAELLYNQKAATKAGKEVDGHFLPKKQFMFTEEAGVVMKAAKNDKLTSAWRCAFDNAEWGKDVHADNAVSGEVNLSFDFTALCTMGVFQKLLDPANIENGTASRMLLGLMPASNYEAMPWFDEQKAKDNALIKEGVERLSEMEEVIDSKVLIKAVTKWSNDMAKECRETKDLSRDMLRRRAGIIGQTSTVIYALVENKRKGDKLCISKNAISFGLVMADYALDAQCQVYKDYAQTAAVTVSLSGERKNTKNKVLFDALPEKFGYNDIKPLVKNSANARKTIQRYSEQGWIIKIARGRYKKVKNEDYNRT